MRNVDEQPELHGFAAKLRSLRKSRGMSLREMEECLGIGRSTIDRWENGAPPPKSFETFQLLADFFEVPVGFLLDQSGSLDKALQASPLIKQLLERLAALEGVRNGHPSKQERQEGQHENHSSGQ